MDKHDNRYLFLRSLLPSPTSLVGCIVGAVLIVASHLLAISLHYGTILPSVLNGDWAAAYTNHIVQPIEKAINNSFLSGIVNIFFWGLAGLIVYYAVAYAFNGLRGWKEVEENIQYSRGVVIKHPAQKSYILRASWRFAVIIVLIVFLVLMQPVFKWLFGVDSRLLGSAVGPPIIVELALAVVIWALVLHFFVVISRLYMFRTRLGTDIF